MPLDSILPWLPWNGVRRRMSPSCAGSGSSGWRGRLEETMSSFLPCDEVLQPSGRGRWRSSPSTPLARGMECGAVSRHAPRLPGFGSLKAVASSARLRSPHRHLFPLSKSPSDFATSPSDARSPFSTRRSMVGSKPPSTHGSSLRLRRRSPARRSRLQTPFRIAVADGLGGSRPSPRAAGTARRVTAPDSIPVRARGEWSR